MKAGYTDKVTLKFSDGHPPFTADKTTPNTAAIHNLSESLTSVWV